MARGFFRELKHYSLYSIAKELETDIDKTKSLVGILKRYGIVKGVNKSKPDYVELSNQDIVLTDVSEKTPDIEYVFDFVGVVVLQDHVFKCYPKYITSTAEPMEHLKKVLKVIKKYNSREQLIYLYNGEDDGKIFNHLAVSLHLLEEYFTYGLYTNQREIIEINGEGEVLWDRTINETFAYIQNNRPYYMELKTHNNIDNDTDYFRCLHESVISQCSSELRKVGLLDLFDIVDVELTHSLIENFGDTDYILYRLQQEIQTQYVTRKKNLLKTLYSYIANTRTDESDISLSLYGTNSFNLVWERVCADNFGNVLDEKLESLPLGVSKEYENMKNKALKKIIDNPVWHKNTPNICDKKTDTLKPDLVCIYPCTVAGDYCFGIFDAKYYNINFVQQSSNWKVTGQPGVGDVTKQYLYQLAFDDFIIKQGYQYVQNLFLCPQEDSDADYGYVEMKMMHAIGDKELENILVVKLYADEMYDYFLSGKQIQKIWEYIPQVSQRLIVNQNFSGRMMAYLRKMVLYSQIAELKMEMKSEHGRLIYPEKIKREVGAKLIYDTICPVASGTFYGFNPYEEEYGNRVAENGDDSYSMCEQIAEAAMNIEREIKKLNETELKNRQTIEIILKKSFEKETNISSMAEGRMLNLMIEKIMELIREMYL